MLHIHPFTQCIAEVSVCDQKFNYVRGAARRVSWEETETGKERESMYVRERESVCVCVWERERGSMWEKLCVWMCMCVCVCVCVCVWVGGCVREVKEEGILSYSSTENLSYSCKAKSKGGNRSFFDAAILY